VINSVSRNLTVASLPEPIDSGDTPVIIYTVHSGALRSLRIAAVFAVCFGIFRYVAVFRKTHFLKIV
jgi:hypothetical protein